MPGQRVLDAQTGFGGGLNLSADVSELAPDELRNARNARLTEFGGASRRGGTQRTHAAALAAAPVRGGYGWVHGDVVEQLAVCNGKLFTGTYTAGINFAERTGALDSTTQPSFEGFRDNSADVCYIADGGALNKWNGSALTVNIASTPNVAQLAMYNLRLFGINGTDERLYWSAIGNGDTLGVVASGGGSAIVRTFAQQALIGLMPLGASLCLFHRAGVSRFTGWSLDDINIEAGTTGVSADTGTIAPRSLVRVENVGYFVAERGVYMATEGGVFPIGQKIDALVRTLPHTEFHRIQSGHNKLRREVWFYFPDVGVYCYNYAIKAWSGPWDGAYLGTRAMWQTVDSNNIPVILFGSDDGFVLRADQASLYRDDVDSSGGGGAAYPMELQLHRMYFDEPEGEKSLRYVYVTANAVSGAAANLLWESEHMSGQQTIPGGLLTTWDVGTWDVGAWPVPRTLPRRVHGWGRGTFFDVTIQDLSEAETSYSRVSLEGFYTARRY